MVSIQFFPFKLIFLIFRQQQLDATVIELMKQMDKVQQELKDPELLDEMALARVLLKKNPEVLQTSMEVYIRHRELYLTEENLSFAFKDINNAVYTIGCIAKSIARPSTKPNRPRAKPRPYRGFGDLVRALDDFDVGKLSS